MSVKSKKFSLAQTDRQRLPPSFVNAFCMPMKVHVECFDNFFLVSLSLSVCHSLSVFLLSLSLPSNWLKNWFRVLSFKTFSWTQVEKKIEQNRLKSMHKTLPERKEKFFILTWKKRKLFFFALFFFVTMSPYVQRCVQDVAPLSKTANTKKIQNSFFCE